MFHKQPEERKRRPKEPYDYRKEVLKQALNSINHGNSNVADVGLIEACRGLGNLEMAEAMIMQGADVNTAINSDDNYTALAAACSSHNVEIVELLIRHKANLNPLNSNFKQSPLMLQFRLWNIFPGDFLNPAACKVVQMLLEHKADVNIPYADSKETCLTQLIEAIQSAGSEKEFFVGKRAGLNDSLRNILKLVIENTIDLDLDSKLNGKNALELASEHSNLDDIKEILEDAYRARKSVSPGL